MGAIASQITIVYSSVYSDADQRKHESFALLAFVRGIHRWPVNSPHKGLVTRKCSQLMTSSWWQRSSWPRVGDGRGLPLIIVPDIMAPDRFRQILETILLPRHFVKYDDVIKWKHFPPTGHLCGEFTGPGEFPTQRPVTRSFDDFFDLRPNKRLSKQPWGWWLETPSWSLWRQCNGHSNIGHRKMSCTVAQSPRSLQNLGWTDRA